MFCGKTFISNAKFKKYCSVECQEQGVARRERQHNYDRHKRDFEEAHPNEVYVPRKYRGHPPKEKVEEAPKKKLSDRLIELKAQGKDYAEEQRKETIEMFARIIL